MLTKKKNNDIFASSPEELRHLEKPVELERIGGCVGTVGGIDAILVCPGGELVSTASQGQLVLWKVSTIEIE